MQDLEEIRRIKAHVEGRLLALPGVTGVDIGRKTVAGEKTDVLAIRVLVRNKKAKGELVRDEIVPPEIEGVPTDVIERDFRLAGSF